MEKLFAKDLTAEQKKFELRKRAFNLIHSYVKRQKKEYGSDKVKFISKIIEGSQKIIPQATDEIETTFRAFDHYKGSEERFLNEITEAVINMMARHMSLKEIEKVHSDRSIEVRKNHILSRLLHFNFESGSEEVTLHVPVAFFKDGKSLVESFKEGLEALAQKMLKDPNFKSVKRISAHSPLVKEGSRLLRKMGFEVLLDENGEPTGDAHISKEKIIELYGQM